MKRSDKAAWTAAILWLAAIAMIAFVLWTVSWRAMVCFLALMCVCAGGVMVGVMREMEAKEKEQEREGK